MKMRKLVSVLLELSLALVLCVSLTVYSTVVSASGNDGSGSYGESGNTSDGTSGNSGTDASGSGASGNDSTPASEETTPAKEETTPAKEETTPAKEETTPSTPAAENTSAEEESAPAAAEPAPAPAPEEPAQTPQEIAATAAAATFTVTRSGNGSQTVEVSVPAASGRVTVTGDYTGVTNNNALSTVIAEKNANVIAALNNTIAAAAAQTGTSTQAVFGPLKVQMYQRGEAILDGFGTYRMKVNVGPTYNGRMAKVYICHRATGLVTMVEIPVVNGNVVVGMEDMGTVMVVF